MKKLLLSFFALFCINVNATELICFNPRIQDNQITTRFQFSEMNGDISVFLQIPTREFGLRDAYGRCVVEEDSREFRVRCDQVYLSRTKSYFVRLDGRTATVAENGRIIAKIPCKSPRYNLEPRE